MYSAWRLKFNSSKGPLWKWLSITSGIQSTNRGMCVLFISLNKHYLELVMMNNKYWKFILSKCSGFTKQIYKWESIFFNLCNNLMLWEMTNGARKAVTGHAGGQRAVKKENWNPAFPAPVLVLSQLLCKSRSPFTSYTKMHGRRKKTPKPVWEQVENSL